ncbi:LolA family protein [Rhodococcus sp. BE178]|uniref:LolA family protein n=1 Tax=Rhodococcus sp. BE178 TaxID=2817737 RepID=UPI003D1B788B
MTAWVQVLVTMADGPSAPIRGVIRKMPDAPERVRIFTAGDRMPMIVGVGGGDVRIWRDRSKVRVETLDGQPLFITDGTTVWQFEQPGEPPLEGSAGRVRYLGTGSDLLFSRPAQDWVGSDYTRPAGLIGTTKFLGRRCWTVDLAPGRYKEGLLRMVVDAETGAVLAQGNDAVGSNVSYVELSVGEPVDPDLFTWSGPVCTFEDRQREYAAEREAERSSRTEWFRNNVTDRPLTARVLVDLSVVETHAVDPETGAFEASLDGGLATGILARRPRSDQPWNLRWQGTIHRWSTDKFDWAVVLHQAELDPDALTALQATLHPGETAINDTTY